MLIPGHNEGPAGCSVNEEDIRDEIFTFILAGHVTMTNALSWTWYLLSQHPEVERRLHAELDTVLCGDATTVESMSRLSYTRMIFSESLRLYPPVWMIGRRAINDCEIGGYWIPSDAIVIMSQYLLHHDPRYYPDPFRFEPLRWTPEAQAERPQARLFPICCWTPRLYRGTICLDGRHSPDCGAGTTVADAACPRLSRRTVPRLHASSEIRSTDDAASASTYLRPCCLVRCRCSSLPGPKKIRGLGLRAHWWAARSSAWQVRLQEVFSCKALPF